MNSINKLAYTLEIEKAVNYFFPKNIINSVEDLVKAGVSDRDIQFKYNIFLGIGWHEFTDCFIRDNWDDLAYSMEFLEKLPLDFELAIAPAFIIILYKRLLTNWQLDESGIDFKSVLIFSFNCLKEAVDNNNRKSWFFKQTPEQQVIWARVLLNYQRATADLACSVYCTSSSLVDMSQLFKDILEANAHNIYASYLEKFNNFSEVDPAKPLSGSISENIEFAQKLEKQIKIELCSYCAENHEKLIYMRSEPWGAYDFLKNTFITESLEAYEQKWSVYLHGPEYYLPLNEAVHTFFNKKIMTEHLEAANQKRLFNKVKEFEVTLYQQTLNDTYLFLISYIWDEFNKDDPCPCLNSKVIFDELLIQIKEHYLCKNEFQRTNHVSLMNSPMTYEEKIVFGRIVDYVNKNKTKLSYFYDIPYTDFNKSVDFQKSFKYSII